MKEAFVEDAWRSRGVRWARVLERKRAEGRGWGMAAGKVWGACYICKNDLGKEGGGRKAEKVPRVLDADVPGPSSR